MNVQLPEDVERSIEAAVHRGLFASVDDAMTEAARLLLQEIDRGRPETEPHTAAAIPDPLLGVWRDCAEEIDEIVADAMRHRREEVWREIPGE